MNNRRAVDAWM